jgi:glycosyltransferase involved in cell wall biosynthesis
MEQYKRIINSTHQNWEWLIFDDSDEPISEIENIPDSRIRIFKESAASNLSIGAKRNFLILQARGEYIAHVDDDDIYSNNYLTAMLNDLLSNSASLHYLNSWIALRKDDQSYWAYTSSCMLPVIEGWGFTFFYRKELGLRIKFPEDNWEDHGWLQKVIDANIDCSHSDDTERLVIKIIHDRNTSRFPWNLARRLSD